MMESSYSAVTFGGSRPKSPKDVTDPPVGWGGRSAAASGDHWNRRSRRRPGLAQVEGPDLLPVRTLGALGDRVCGGTLLAFPYRRTGHVLVARSWRARRARSSRG